MYRLLIGFMVVAFMGVKGKIPHTLTLHPYRLPVQCAFSCYFNSFILVLLLLNLFFVLELLCLKLEVTLRQLGVSQQIS